MVWKEEFMDTQGRAVCFDTPAILLQPMGDALSPMASCFLFVTV